MLYVIMNESMNVVDILENVDHHQFMRLKRSETGCSYKLLDKVDCKRAKLVEVFKPFLKSNGIYTYNEKMYSIMNKINGVKYSKYRGVTWSMQHNKWLVRLTYNKTKYFLGLFDDEKEAEAGQAYQDKLKELMDNNSNTI
jgi:hypothetical protein